MPSVTAGVACVVAALTVALVLPPSRARPPGRLSDLGRRLTARPWPVAAVGASGVGLLAEGRTLVLGLVAVTGAVGAWLLVRSRRSRRAAGDRTDRVVEACEALSGELGAGQPPVRALRQACESWDHLTPVAVAAELGADVPAALRRAAEASGAQGLREVASAWQVSAASGATMALAVARVADSARRRQATSRLVASELAGARATASLLAVLPLGVLAMGAGIGGDPVAFLLRTTVGLACLAAGVVLAVTGLLWVERIAARASTW